MFAVASAAANAVSNIFDSLFATAYRFDVFVGSMGLGEWAKCDGLTIDYQVSTYQTAMNPDENNIASPRFCSSCKIDTPLYFPDVAVTGSDPTKNGVITT